MTVHEKNTPYDESVGDADLILRARSGDTEAFGELWRRHYPSGLSVARSITSSIDPDDLVQESYTRIYQAIIKGGGPNGSFRAYLFTSIRNTAAAWGRARRETAIDALDSVADPASTDQAANEALDRSLTAQAYRSLPSRWQEVLWYTEIEQMKPQEVGPLLGMKSGAVSQLAFRAREGLREAWIQAHLRSAAEGSACQWTIEHLGAHSRGNLSARDHKRLELHLDECARCMIVAAEAKDVSRRLALVLLPLVLGVTGASGYLATLQGGVTPIVALAAMPSSIPDAVFAGDPGAGAVATAVTGSGAGGGAAGSAGGTGASSGGGMLAGMRALVGVGSAALVVAGVVAAATIIPELAGTDAATSLPSAGDANSSSITSDVGPDESMSFDEPIVIEQPGAEPDKTPAPPVVLAPAPSIPEQDGPVVAPSTAPAPPRAPAEPEDTDPTARTEPTDPTDPTDLTAPTARTEPTDPTDPTDLTAPTARTEPTEAPTWSPANIRFEGARVHYNVPITGAPEMTVEALLDGNRDGGDEIVLDANGQGIVDIRPDALQYLFAGRTTVTFRYVLAEGPGPAADTTLLALGEPIELSAGSAPVDEVSATPADEAITPGPAEQPPAPVETAPVTPAPAPVESSPVIPTPEEAAPAAPESAPVVDDAADDAADVAVTALPPAESSAPAE